MIPRSTFNVLGTAVVSAGLCGVASAQQYAVTAINPPSPGSSSVAYGVNSYSAVAASVPSSSRAGLWSTGFLALLQPLPGDGISNANSINDSSLVVGISAGSFVGFPVRWNPATGLAVELPNLGPRAGSAMDVNNIGAIVGEAYESTPGGNMQRAVLWPDGGGIINLGVLPGHFLSFATGINNLGQVCGDSSTNGSVITTRAFFRDSANGSPLVDIGDLGAGWAQSADINDFGEIVGRSRDPNSTASEPFRWRAATGVMTGLGSVNGNSVFVHRTNNRGQVVGYYFQSGPGGGDRALLFTPGQGPVELNTQIAPGSGWRLERAYGLNNAGNIVGVGTLNGVTRGFLLTPGPNHVVPGCFADLNRDEVVNVVDLTILLGAFGQSSVPGAGADMNGDGQVNVLDLVVMLGGFGSACL